MIRRSFTARRSILIRPTIIPVTYQEWDSHLARASYSAQGGPIIGATATGTTTATSTSTTRTISTRITSITAAIGIRLTPAGSGSMMRSIAGAPLMETEKRPASTVADLDHNLMEHAIARPAAPVRDRPPHAI